MCVSIGQKAPESGGCAYIGPAGKGSEFPLFVLKKSKGILVFTKKLLNSVEGIAPEAG